MDELPVKVINSMGLRDKISGESATTELPVSIIFGPKVGGAFFPNLMGNLSLTTMDRWFMRTWGRITGTLFKGDPKTLNNNIRNFKKNLTPEMAEKFNLDIQEVLEDDDALFAASNKVFNKVANNNFKEKSLPLFINARAIKNFLGGSLSPSGAQHRVFIRKTMEKAKNILAENGIDTDQATIQALIWYPEQAFYRKSGTRTKEPANRDYGAEAILMAVDHLVSQGESQNAAAKTVQSLVRGGRRLLGRTEYESLQGQDQTARQRERKQFVKPRVISELRRQLYGGQSPQAQPKAYSRRAGKRARVELANGEQREINPIAEHRIKGNSVTFNRLKDAGVSPINFFELSANDSGVFIDAMNIAKEADQYASSVFVYEEPEYRKMKVFLSENGTAGFAVKPDGDIVSVFKDKKSEYKNASVSSLLLATERGGTKLDAFDTALPGLYSLNGFKVASRLPFDPNESPPDWDSSVYKAFNNGQPDVVFMVFDPKNFSPYRKEGQVASSYDEAIELQEEAIYKDEKVSSIRDKFYRDPKKVEKAVEENKAAFETRSATNQIPRFSLTADPEAQYVARNPEEAFEPSPELLDRYARKNGPDLSKEEQKVIDDFAAEPEPKKTPGQTYIEATDTSRWTYFLTKLKQEAVFNYAELERLYVKDDLKIGDPESSAWRALIFADRARGVASDQQRHGAVVYKDGVVKTEPFEFNGQMVGGMIDVFKPLYENPYEISLEQPAQAYFIAKRAVRLKEEGKKVPGNPESLAKVEEIIQRYINPETGRPIIEEVYETWQAFNEKTIDFLQASGVLDAETAQNWRDYSDYVPYYREVEDEKVDIGGYPSVFGGMTGAVKMAKLKGQEKAVNIPLLDAITMNQMMAIELGMKNIAQQRVMRDMIEAGMAREIPPGSNEPVSQVVELRVNGKKRRFTVDNPLVYESLLPMEAGAQSLEKILGIPAMWMRELITRNPVFSVKNILRDTFSSWVTSGSKYIPILGSLEGMFKGVDALSKFGLVGGYDNKRDSDSLKRNIRKILKEKGVNIPRGTRLEGKGVFEIDLIAEDKVPFVRSLIAFWDVLGDVSTTSDVATRYAVYKDVLARTGSDAAASLAAAEVINFARRGRNVLARLFAAATPFLNARYQGLDVLYRSHTGRNLAMMGKDAQPLTKGDQIGTAIFRGSILAALAGLHWALVSDDEQYKNVPDEVKDLNAVFPTPWGTPFLFPLPFEVGLFYWTAPQRILDYYPVAESFEKEGGTSGRELSESARRFAMGTAQGLVFNPLQMQAIAPLAEVMMNYDSFKQRDIVPQYIADSSAPQFQRTPYTSLFASAFAKAMPDFMEVSPIKVDYWLNAQFPGIGTFVLGGADSLARMPLIQGDRTKVIPGQGFNFKSADWWDYPFVRRFFRDKYDAGALQDFYDVKKRLNQVTKSLDNDLLSEPEKRAIYMTHWYLLRHGSDIKELHNKLGDLRKEERAIIISDRPDSVKKQQLDQIKMNRATYNAQMFAIKKLSKVPSSYQKDATENEWEDFVDSMEAEEKYELQRILAPIYRGRE